MSTCIPILFTFHICTHTLTEVPLTTIADNSSAEEKQLFMNEINVISDGNNPHIYPEDDWLCHHHQPNDAHPAVCT